MTSNKLKLSNVLLNLREYYDKRQLIYGIENPMPDNITSFQHLYNIGIVTVMTDIVHCIFDNTDYLKLFDYSDDTNSELLSFISHNRYDFDLLKDFIDKLIKLNGVDTKNIDDKYNSKSIFSISRKIIYNELLVSLLTDFGVKFKTDSDDTSFTMDNVELLGLGNHGYAFDIIGTGRILKVTSDKSEYIVANKVMENQLANIDRYKQLFPEYFFVYDADVEDYSQFYDENGETITRKDSIYHIILEKLNEFTYFDKEIINLLIDNFSEINLENMGIDPKNYDDYTMMQYYEKNEIKHKYFENSIFVDNEWLSKMVTFIFEIYNLMKEDHWNDLHSENIMYDNQNNIKAIDLTA